MRGIAGIETLVRFVVAVGFTAVAALGQRQPTIHRLCRQSPWPWLFLAVYALFHGQATAADGSGALRAANETPVAALAGDAPAAADSYPGPAASFAASGPATYLVPLVPLAGHETLQGFVRVINRSPVDGNVRIEATDDEGYRHEPIFLSIGANETSHFNSDDLEFGNAAKGLSDSLGSGQGAWRLVLSSDLNIEVLAYIRTSDGLLTSMHDVAPNSGNEIRVATFNPGSNPNQVSRLRLINLGESEAAVAIRGVDDLGESPGDEVRVVIPPRAAREYSARQLESGDGGVDGALGDGTGKWRLVARTDGLVAGMSLLENPTGHLTNLSTGPVAAYDGEWHRLAFFPSSFARTGSRRGFVRLVNRASREVVVDLRPYNDLLGIEQFLYATIGAGRTLHLNTRDLEYGNDEKGLRGNLGGGSSHWHMNVGGGDSLDVLCYVRTDAGFLTSVHDPVPSAGLRHHVAVFNPGSNANQESFLRVVNVGEEDATVTIAGIDDRGASPGTAVTVVVKRGQARRFTAALLESGGDGVDGALGDGHGKWRLVVESDVPVVATSLLRSTRTGTLTNLSSVGGRAANVVLQVAENTGAGEPVGQPVTVALDGDGAVRHSLEGPDAAQFAIDPDSGQIRTVEGASYDYESRIFHWLFVKVANGDDTAHVVVRVEVTNVVEVPPRLNPPSATTASATSTRLLWAAPGDGNITSYDYRYRLVEEPRWTEVVDTGLTETEAIIDGLTPNAVYIVQIRAVNDREQTQGPWSDSQVFRFWPHVPDVRTHGPWHFTNISLDFEEPPTDFETFCVTIFVHTDVHGNVPIYIAAINQKINKMSLYAGIQTHIGGVANKADPKPERRGRGAIFSRWEERALGAIQDAPGGLHESGGYEGDFISVRNDYAWTRGTYRMCLVKSHVVGGAPLPNDYDADDISYGWGRFVHTWVRYEVTDLGSGDTTFIGALAFPGDALRLEKGNAVFYEAYGSGSFAARDMRSFAVDIKQIQVDGRDARFDLIRERINPTHPRAPVMVNTTYRSDGTIHTRVGVFTGQYGTSWRTLYP